jgi:hypothetical protein
MQLIKKYEGLQKYIELIGRDENEILEALPEVAVSKFIGVNRSELSELK